MLLMVTAGDRPFRCNYLLYLKDAINGSTLIYRVKVKNNAVYMQKGLILDITIKIGLFSPTPSTMIRTVVPFQLIQQLSQKHLL